MSLNETWAQSIHALEVVAPWVTGGVGGAILGYLLKRKTEKPQLLIRTTVVDYALPRNQELFQALNVSYKGAAYEHLSFLQVRIQNTGQQVVPSSPYIIELEPGSQLVDSTVTAPGGVKVICDQGALHPHEFRYTIDTLQPSDPVVISLLVTGGTQMKCTYRGQTSVDVTAEGRLQGGVGLERDIFSAINVAALYEVMGFVPFISGPLRAAVIVGSAPLIARIVMRWKRPWAQTVQIGSISDSSQVTVVGKTK